MIKHVVGYEGYYEVNEFGEVFSVDRVTTRKNGTLYTTKRRKLVQTANNTGRLRVVLYKNGVSEYRFVHRIVAESFLGIPNIKMQINHKDGNPKNNNLTNLEWVTQSENVGHAIKNGFMNYYVLSIEQENELKQIWNTNKFTKSDLAKMFGVSRYTIRRVVNNERKYER
jgi:hypothetical protein